MTVPLPSLPVDDVSLDMYWTAINPGPDAERTSLFDLLDLMARMAGFDPDAVDEEQTAEIDQCDIVVMRDPTYNPHDLIEALIIEVRRLRGEKNQ